MNNAFRPAWLRNQERRTAPRPRATEPFDEDPPTTNTQRTTRDAFGMPRGAQQQHGAPRTSVRTAGVVMAAALVGDPLLPRFANFRTNTFGDAFWLLRTPGQREGTLMLSTGATILRDLCEELGYFTSDQAWTGDLLRRLNDAAVSAGGTSPGPVPTSGALPLEWLRVALWYTYSRDTYPRMVAAVLLPTSIAVGSLPMLGERIPTSAPSEVTRRFAPFDPSELTINPFGPYQNQENSVGNPPPASTSSDGGGALLLAIGIALAVAGDESK